MNRIRTLILVAASCLALSGCDDGSLDLNGKHYPGYGVVNMDVNKDPNVVYEISAGSVICSIIFFETVFVPVYLIGWDFWHPVKLRTATPIKAE